MPCTPIFTAGPVNPGRQVDKSTSGQVRLSHNPLHSYIYLSTCGRQVDRSTGEPIRNTHNALHYNNSGPINPGRKVSR